MAKSSVISSGKFLHLVETLGLPEPHVLGLLEFMWQSAYASCNPRFKTAKSLEIAARWKGQDGAFASAVSDPVHNFVDVKRDGTFEIHDFWDHAPEYVKKRKKYSDHQKNGVKRRQSKTFHVGESPKNCGESPKNGGDFPVYPTQPNPTQAYIDTPNGVSSPETPEDPALDAAPDPVVLTFKCDGRVKEFHLRESKVEQYEKTYSTINVREKLLHLWQWCEDNPSRRKTAKGMPAFLSRNLGREVDQKRDRLPLNGKQTYGQTYNSEKPNEPMPF